MNVIASTIMIEWRPITGSQPEEGSLVLVTGRYQGEPGAGRWVALARRVGNTFFSDETGDELFPPTHWHEVLLPID